MDTGERVGLLGRNGAGKTTIFRIMTGQARPGRGRRLPLAPGKRLGLISQIPGLSGRGTPSEDVLDTAFALLHAMEREMEQLAAQMGRGRRPRTLLARYDRPVRRLRGGGGYDTETGAEQGVQRPEH